MKIDVKNAKTNLSKLVQLLIDKKEDLIIIYKNGIPVAQMTLFNQDASKRIGAAKKEMNGFDISLEEFNSIPIGPFDGE